MEKRIASAVIGMMLVVLGFGSAFGAVHTRSDYTMITTSNVLVLPVNGGESVLPVLVVTSSGYKIAPGQIVNCIFQELWEGELTPFGTVQSINVGEDGYARIPVPSYPTAKFRYATLWVEGDVASVEHKMFWCTNDLSMPAQIVPVDVSATLSLGETWEFIYQVLNAWGDPIPNIQVKVTRGNSYVSSPQSAVTDSFGEVGFDVTAPSGSVGNTELRVQVEPLSFIQTAMMVAWDVGPTPPPSTLPSGSFSASPTSLSAGECATLTLTTTNTTSVVLTPTTGVTGSFTSSGGTVTVCPTGTTTYTVTLSGPSGQKSYSVTITVGSTPPPTGTVATIEASNATSYDGSLPVFDLSIGQTFSATFVAKDSSGNPVSGVSLTSVYPSCVVTTDSNGQATVTLTGASGAGSDMGQIYVTSDSSKFLDFRIVTGGTTPPPPTGDVATITAVNPSDAEGSMPVFNATVGQTLSAIFVAKDSSGNVVSGVSLTVVYPAGTVTTDSSGQVTVTIPASSFSGWDSDRISVTSDSNVYLDFKIVYS